MEPDAKPRILLLSAYDAASHRRWREGLVAALPDFDFRVLTLPARHFRWRIRGNPLAWLDEPALAMPWDLVIATSMVDLATLKGLSPELAAVPALLYMHENQLAYPDSGRQHPSAEPAMVNLYAALAADQVAFNSAWNRDSFIEGVEAFTARLPDGIPAGLGRRLLDRSTLLPVPVDDHLFRDRHQPPCRLRPHLLWNHRWEYDKGPERLLALLEGLEASGRDYRLSVVGEGFRRTPAAFDTLRHRFGHRLEHFGYLSERGAYDRLLATADVVVSTTLHDFQGLAMLEAMAAGCLALAPDRLAYPEYVPAAQRYPSHPDDPEREAAAAVERLLEMLDGDPRPEPPEAWRWSRLAPAYRELLTAVMGLGLDEEE